MVDARYTVYGDCRSGNCYKIALLMRLLDIPFEWRETDVFSGVTRKPPFLAMNPNGRVPLLKLPDGRCLAESNAILLYLAEDSRYLPLEPYARALVYQWLFFEQYSHEPYIAVARFLLHFLRDQEHDPERIALLHERGNQALGVMETVLEGRPWIAGDDYSIADIALYAYTHVAETGGFDLSRFPAVTAWLNRVANQPGHFGMEDFSP